MKLTSSAFREHTYVPLPYTCNGLNINPPINIEGIPSETKSLCLTIEDIDAHQKPCIHWLVYNIPPDTPHIYKDSVPEHANVGESFNGVNKYMGPTPIDFMGVHRYKIQVHALRIQTEIPSGSHITNVVSIITPYIIETATLIGKVKGTVHPVNTDINKV